ncbi:uncharacterized protein [Physeter macrocephalus]|uniref:Uncharacterized protein n=1 Tax=Physeter macrocephalus TaxID=9755 RepID=A0A455BYM5_PHYMC|nr:uncharacterized protein LOC114487608 [Physeter catodon]|eukprot:XP_028354145.1 uncharacterized protein LOC114487608 [Physeter catodon]
MRIHAEDKFYCIILQILLWTSETSHWRGNVRVLNWIAQRPGLNRETGSGMGEERKNSSNNKAESSRTTACSPHSGPVILSKCVQPSHSFAQTPSMVFCHTENTCKLFMMAFKPSYYPSNLLSHSPLFTVPSPVTLALLNHRLTKHTSISGQHFCSLPRYSHGFLPHYIQISAQMLPSQRELLKTLLKRIPTFPPPSRNTASMCHHYLINIFCLLSTPSSRIQPA